MKNMLRLFVPLLLLLLLIVPVAAQEDDVYCGDLVEADCDLLLQNAAVMRELDSVRYELAFTFGGFEVEGMAFDMAFESDGTVFANRTEVNAIKDEILNTTIGEMLELLDNGEFLARGVELTERFLVAPAADLRASVTLPDFDGTGPMTFSGNLMYVDGSLYFSSPDLPEIPGVERGQWLELDLVEGMNITVEFLENPDLLQGMMSGGAPFSPGGGMPSGGFGGGDEESNEMFNRIMEIVNAPYWDEMDSPEFEAAITQVERLDDAEVDGVPVAVFQTTIDMAAMVATDTFQQMYADIFSISTPQIGEEEREAMLPVLMDMMSSMEIVATESVGLDDAFTYDSNFEWSMTLDLVAMVTAVEGEDAVEDMPEDMPETLPMSMTWTMALRDHNQPVEITAPASAVSVIDMVQGFMMGAAMGGMESSAELTPKDDGSGMDAAAAVTGVLPTDWDEMGGGIYVGPDSATLVFQELPVPSEFVLSVAAGQVNLDTEPELTETRSAPNGVEWSLYAAAQDDMAFAFALGAVSSNQTYLVILQSEAASHEELVETVYEPVLAALSE